MSKFDGLFNKTINSVPLMDKNKNALKVGDSVQLDDHDGTWKISKIKGETVVLDNVLETAEGEITSMELTRGTIQLNSNKAVGN